MYKYKIKLIQPNGSEGVNMNAPPEEWTTTHLEIFAKRIIRSARGRKVIDVTYIPHEIFDKTFTTFNLHLGKRVKMSKRERYERMKVILENERILSAL